MQPRVRLDGAGRRFQNPISLGIVDGDVLAKHELIAVAEDRQPTNVLEHLVQKLGEHQLALAQAERGGGLLVLALRRQGAPMIARWRARGNRVPRSTGYRPSMPERTLSALARLLDVVARLRAPDGCPWDRQQTAASMAPHLLEEAFEAADAARGDDPEALCEELGDVLMNVLMIAQIESEATRFDACDVATAIAEKLVRRHPHVFGDARVDDPQAALGTWEAIKRVESGGDTPRGVLDGVPAALPALLRAYRVGEKVARVGFDWPDAAGPRAKVDEELAELDEALASGDRAHATAELGDVLFSLANLARHHGLEPETALREAIDRFSSRFRAVERTLGTHLGDADLQTLEAAWQAAKRAEG